MYVLDEATAPITTSLIFALLGSGGFIAGLIGLFKLRGDKDTAAVAQAEGANESLTRLNQQALEALDRANARADYYQTQLAASRDRYDRAVELWGPFPENDEPPSTGGKP